MVVETTGLAEEEYNYGYRNWRSKRTPRSWFSGTAGAGNTAGTGVEGAYGGAMIGPDSFAGIAPVSDLPEVTKVFP